jgi:hypothetical protein
MCYPKQGAINIADKYDEIRIDVSEIEVYNVIAHLYFKASY